MQLGKLILLMTDLNSNMEINCAHIDFSKNDFALESYLDLDNFNRNIWIRFRISAHNIEIEKGRHQNIPLNERICKLCKLEIEDELHFLQQCPILNSFRTEAMLQIPDICKMFASLDNKSKFIWLLSNENIIIINIVSHKTVDVINRN